jgi:hypothetical protein
VLKLCELASFGMMLSATVSISWSLGVAIPVRRTTMRGTSKPRRSNAANALSNFSVYIFREECLLHMAELTLSNFELIKAYYFEYESSYKISSFYSTK